MDELNVIRCKEIFGITEKDNEIKVLEIEKIKLEDEMKEIQSTNLLLRSKLYESTERENLLKKENEELKTKVDQINEFDKIK